MKKQKLPKILQSCKMEFLAKIGSKNNIPVSVLCMILFQGGCKRMLGGGGVLVKKTDCKDFKYTILSVEQQTGAKFIKASKIKSFF